MTVGLYIRVSTQEQAKEGYSIPAQKERLIAHCGIQGWTDYKIYTDEGVSAKDTNRPELKRMMDDVKKGKISIILVYRLDRFTRSVRDLYTMLETLEKYKCAFASATEPYDTSNAMGRMFIGLVALLAQWETENLSERIKMALEEKVSSGERVGNVPYGFDLNEKEKLVSNEKAKVVLDMIDKFKNGMSANQIARHLTRTNEDRTEWHPQAVIRILKNPALYGATRWNEEVYENTHEGIISKDEFLKIQQMLEDRGAHRRREVESIYLFQGVLSCPYCNNPLSVNRYVRKRKDGSEYQGAVYKCQRCYKNGINIQIGEQRFLDALKIYMKNLRVTEKYLTPAKEENNELEFLTKRLQKVEKTREKYQRAWANDRMTDEEFDKRMDETREIYDDLKRQIDEFKTPEKVDVEEIKNIIFMFNESFHYLTHAEKRSFISRFMRDIKFDLIPQPPKDRRHKKGKDLVQVLDIMFY